MPLDFTAIDFETANGSAASACSVGLVKVRDGQVVDRIGWYIRPPLGHDHFVDWNIQTLNSLFFFAALGLGLNEAAYMAEIVRAGINSVG